MIITTYREDAGKLQAIINQKQTIQNVLHNIKHDKNIEFYMEELLYFASNPDEIEGREVRAYHFRQNTKEVFKLLVLLQDAMLSSEHIKNKSGAEIAKPCSVFSDYNGKYIMRFFGYFGLIAIIKNVVEYEELIQRKTNIEFTEFHNHHLSKKDILRGDNSYFVDYEKKNKYIEEMEAEYKEHKQELLTDINDVLNIIKCGDTALEQLGISIWDTRIIENGKKFQELKEKVSRIYDMVEK